MTSPAQFSCLIVEDDRDFAELLRTVVCDQGGEVVLCRDIASATKALSKTFDVILLDNHLPDGTGYELYPLAARQNPESPVIMITGAPDLGQAVSLTRNGLFDYLTKPIEAEAIEACLRRIKTRLQRKPGALQFADWFGKSPEMEDVLRQFRQAARVPSATVLITGETGSGKDMAARLLHQLTYPDGKAPYVAVNCATLPADMFEAELFGAERGAYTGADKRRPGLVAAAEGGTLFLDEIAEVPILLQAKLLRFLESKQYRSLGSTTEQTFSGRFVAATNKSLSKEVQEGRFREDLLYRFDVFQVELPPLRARKTEIPALAEFLLEQLSKRYERARPLIKPEDAAELQQHSFPGNVRELRNIMERSLLKTDESSRWLKLDVNWKRSPHTSPPPSPVAATVTPAPATRDLPPLEAREYEAIQQAIVEANGGIRRAAAKLGISPQALLRRLEKWPELRLNAPRSETGTS